VSCAELVACVPSDLRFGLAIASCCYHEAKNMTELAKKQIEAHQKIAGSLFGYIQCEFCDHSHGDGSCDVFESIPAEIIVYSRPCLYRASKSAS